MRFKIGSTYTLGYGIGSVKIEKPTAKNKTFKAVRQSDGKSIHFGDPDMPTRQDNPEAKKNYCSRADGLAPRGFNPNTFSLIYWDCIPANPKRQKNDMHTNKVIQRDGRWYVTGKDGKGNLGKKEGYATKEEADKRLREIEFFKRQQNVLIYTNVGKAQISETDTTFEIKGIPITKDDDVMNDVAYLKQHNANGMPTMKEKPVTLRHPVVDGHNVSATQGKGLNYFSGSLIESAPYPKNGSWLVDVSVNKKKLAAQDDGERWTEILGNKEVFGVSTGLTFERNDESGSINGKSYSMIAKNQQYDHLAFLDPKVEKPAGGENTMVRFNAAVDAGEIIIHNLDVNNDDTDEKEERLINRVVKAMSRFFDKDQSLSYNNDELNNNRGNAMFTRDETIEFLANAGITIAANASDEEVKTKFNEYMSKSKKSDDDDEDEETNMKDKKKMKGNSQDCPAWADELITKINTLESQVTANAEAELDLLTEQVEGLKMGINAETAKKMGAEACKDFLAQNSQTYIAQGLVAPNVRVANAGSGGEDLDIDMNAGIE